VRLKKISYEQYLGDSVHNHWKIDGVFFGKKNLIVGENSSGKSRLLNVIHNLAGSISQRDQKIYDGNWNLIFETNRGDFEYSLHVDKGEVLSESIDLDGKSLLERNKMTSKIFSRKMNDYVEISPPVSKLTLHVRRDEKEYDFLEDLIKWSMSVKKINFIHAPTNIEVNENKPDDFNSLGIAPTILSALNDTDVKNVIKNLNKIGYKIEALEVKPENISGVPTIKLINTKEVDLLHPVVQLELSSGMFRAMATFILLQYFLKKTDDLLILIDDIGEGLDYHRSLSFAKLLFSIVKKIPSIQIIATTNDQFMMDSVAIEDWNILKRKKTTVTAMNYINSKKVFDAFRMTGLSNFDLLVSENAKS
jgi:predicted ATP-dependent endonuclease of OLD family